MVVDSLGFSITPTYPVGAIIASHSKSPTGTDKNKKTKNSSKKSLFSQSKDKEKGTPTTEGNL